MFFAPMTWAARGKMERTLSDHQKKLLSAAIAMALADGIIDEQEMELIDQISDELNLDPEARAEVEQMLLDPPNPMELASSAIHANDRLELYKIAARMAAADGQIDQRESAFLRTLAGVLRLSPEEIIRLNAAVH
jgi:uncharacterized membrane protein YebE (DUF533 family)